MDIPAYNWINSYRNFAQVSENLTRSGQPTMRVFQMLRAQYQTRTVVCLRRDFPWLKREKEICRESGFNFVQFPLSPKTPTREQISDLMKLMKTLEPPVHVHCMGGADRTSLFSFIYQLVVNQVPVEEARKQQGWTFAPVWWNYWRIPREYSKVADRMNFEEWVNNGYLHSL